MVAFFNLSETSDVNFKNRLITVQESKSGKKRMIPVDDVLFETLRTLPARFKRGYVFPSPVKDGKPRFGVQRQFGNAVKRAEIEDIRFHDLRHTLASHLAPDHRLRAVKTLDSAYQTDTKTDTAEISGTGESP